MSLDLSPPNPRRDGVAGRLSDAPAYPFFLAGRAPASPETVASQAGARYGINPAPSAHQAAKGRAAAAAAAGVSEDAPHCYLCLRSEAEEQRGKLRFVEGLLLCGACCAEGSLASYKKAAARPAVTAGKHPEIGCLGCLPGPRAKRKASKTKPGRFTSGKLASGSKKQKAARSEAEKTAAAFVAAALAQRG